jgi:3-deoxy-D-manno-octulosonate 8-phosphate phosphatase (KDO 8-P phosphatase)
MNVLEQFARVKTFIFDMDGVITDGTLIIQSGSEWLRTMHMRDGHAMKEASKKGYRVVILSGSFSGPMKKRLKFLGAKDVFMSIVNKKEKLQSYIKKHNLNPEEILYMGDDMPDIACMKMVGLPAIPHDAADDLRPIARYISPFKGGHGCVRDVIEKVLKLNNDWSHE